MSTYTRRSFLGLVGRAAAGAAAITTIPSVLYEERWVRAAAAQTAPNVEATFIALIETVNDATGEDAAATCGRWVMTEFDKALPPLPEGSPSAAVTAILDAAMGGACWTVLDADQAFLTADLRVEFLRSTRVGTVTAVGTVVRRPRRVVFCEAQLFDADEVLLAVSRCTQVVLPAEGRAGRYEEPAADGAPPNDARG
ncbi:MAG: PaaI family thioesterase [Actinobacteria bacterium]|nr:PaaI family thioesterase [Actinomycetota bacterium]